MTEADTHLTPEIRARLRQEATADLARAESAMREVLREMRELHGAERKRHRGYVAGAIISTRIALGRFRIAWAPSREILVPGDVSLPPAASEMKAAAAAEAVIRRAA